MRRVPFQNEVSLTNKHACQCQSTRRFAKRDLVSKVVRTLASSSAWPLRHFNFVTSEILDVTAATRKTHRIRKHQSGDHCLRNLSYKYKLGPWPWTHVKFEDASPTRPRLCFCIWWLACILHIPWACAKARASVHFARAQDWGL